MKYIIATLLFLIACEQKPTDHSYDNLIKRADSVNTRLTDISKRVDTSLMDILNLLHQKELKRQAEICETKYQLTGKEEYRKLGQLYFDSVYYCWLLHVAKFDSSKVIFKSTYKKKL